MPFHGVLEMIGSLMLSSILYGLVLLIFLLLCPLVFQLTLCNVWGKNIPVQMCGIHLLMICGISMLCSACMMDCNTMHLWPLFPRLLIFLVVWRKLRDIRTGQCGLG